MDDAALATGVWKARTKDEWSLTAPVDPCRRGELSARSASAPQPHAASLDGESVSALRGR